MSYANSQASTAKIVKLIEEELKNATSATENFTTLALAVKNDLAEFNLSIALGIIAALAARRGQHNGLRGIARALLLAAFAEIAEEIGSGSVIDGAIVDEEQFFLDWHNYQFATADEKYTARAVTFASDPADSAVGVFRRLTVDHNGQKIESGYHNTTKVLRVLKNTALGAGQGLAEAVIFGGAGGEDGLDYKKGSGGPDSPRSVSILSNNEVRNGLARNAGLFVTGATTNGTAVTSSTLGSWTPTNDSGAPTVVVRATGTGATFRTKVYGIGITGNATTYSIAQDLIGVSTDLYRPVLPGGWFYWDGTWTGTITFTLGGVTQAFTEAAFTSGAGFYFLCMDRDKDLYPKNWATGSAQLKLTVATTHASGELVLQYFDCIEGERHENVWYFYFSYTSDPTAGTQVTWVDSCTFAGVWVNTIAWAFDEAPYAYLNTVATNAVADPA